jgi:hypothetical protein
VGPNPIVRQLLRPHRFNLFCRSTSGTYRVKDVVIVTPHTAGVLIAVVRIREPLGSDERKGMSGCIG